MRRRYSLWALGVLAVALAGCRPGSEPGMEATGPGAGSPALEQAVRGNLQQTTDVNDDLVTVDVINGVAVLSGSVPAEQDRQRAVEIARQTSGVTEVRDRIMVMAPAQAPMGGQQPGMTQPPTGGQPESARPGGGMGETDGARERAAALGTRVQRALNAHTDLADNRIQVAVEGSTVTLTGRVSSEAEKQQAEQVAQGVQGVERVTNSLTVAGMGQ